MVSIVKKIIPIIWIAILFLLLNKVHSQHLSPSNTVRTLGGKEISKDSILSFIDQHMKILKVPGVSLAIINDGEVVYHLVKGYADMDEKEKVTGRTIFEGASLSKPLFAYFVMGFVEEGKLDLDKPLYKYLPYEDISYDERYKKITARMVLTHTTGFPNWRSDHEGDKLFISFEPGTSFQYSGEGYQYLAKVLANILETDDTGLERAYQKRVAQPLNLMYTKYLQDLCNMQNKSKGYKDGKAVAGDDDPNVFGAAFSVHSEAKDFSKWLTALMDKKGLSEESYNELFKTQVVLPNDHPQTQAGITDWTLGFAKGKMPFGTVFGHGGNNIGYTSIFVVAPEIKWGYVMFTNSDQSPLPMMFLQHLMAP
ncbi:MAG: serine hydrolase domain-containing protein [Flavobacteriaceae bacterium]